MLYWKKTDLPRLLSVSLVSLILFYLGYIYRKKESYISMNFKGAAISLIILLIATKLGRVDMIENYYTSIKFLIITSCSGIYLVAYIAKKIEKRFNEIKLINFIGKNTLYITILHFISFKIISIIIIYVYKLELRELSSFPVIDINGWEIIYLIIGLVLPSIYVNILLKLKNIKIRYSYKDKVSFLISNS